MKMTISGITEIGVPIDSALKFSNNLREIAMCVPTAQDFNQIDDKNFTITITVGIAVMKGMFKVKTTLVEQTQNRLVYSMDGHGIGSTLKETLTLDLNSKSATTTEVSWNADMELHGLVSGVSEPVLRKISGDRISETIANIKSKLEGQKQDAVQ